jgi:hypothetical protein
MLPVPVPVRNTRINMLLGQKIETMLLLISSHSQPVDDPKNQKPAEKSSKRLFNLWNLKNNGSGRAHVLR